jgi:hypothetical protein
MKDALTLTVVMVMFGLVLAGIIKTELQTKPNTQPRVSESKPLFIPQPISEPHK